MTDTPYRPRSWSDLHWEIPAELIDDRDICHPEEEGRAALARAARASAGFDHCVARLGGYTLLLRDGRRELRLGEELMIMLPLRTDVVAVFRGGEDWSEHAARHVIKCALACKARLDRDFIPQLYTLFPLTYAVESNWIEEVALPGELRARATDGECGVGFSESWSAEQREHAAETERVYGQ